MEYAYKTGPAHVIAGISAGVLGRVLGTLAVARDWLGPQVSGGLMLGGGLMLAGAGLSWQSGFATAAGIGLAASGVYALATQTPLGAYEAIEDFAHDDERPGSAESVQDHVDEMSAAHADGQDSDGEAEPEGQPGADTRARRSLRNGAKRARKARKRQKRTKQQQRTAQKRRQPSGGRAG